MPAESKYYIISIMEAAWKLNHDLSLVDLIYSAAAKSGYYNDEVENCNDKELAEGLHRLIIDDIQIT